jgi:Leucine-rich repeat (LRR) protein
VALVGLKKLDLRFNYGLTSVPEGLCSLVGLEELHLNFCGLTALPEAVGGLSGLRKLFLDGNEGLTALPQGLGQLRGMEHAGRFQSALVLRGCPGLAALHDLQEREGLPALLAHLMLTLLASLLLGQLHLSSLECFLFHGFYNHSTALRRLTRPTNLV